MLQPSCPLHLPFLLLLLFLPPSLAAGDSTASNVDTVGFWLGFTLLVIVSSLEAAMSVIWTHIHMTSDGEHLPELSCRVCGREVVLATIDPETARTMADEGLGGGCACYFTRNTSIGGGKIEMTADMFCSMMLVPTLMVRRFNPLTSLKAPAELADNVRVFFKPRNHTVRRLLENGVSVIVGLMDVSLGVAGLALNSRSPGELYNALKDPKAPLTFENYSTLFLLYWLLGAVLFLCILPMRSKRRSLQIFGLPGAIAYGVAALGGVVLFALGCWKIDVARKAYEDWRPMLSYWIGGASSISFPFCGVEVFHTFGLVGLVFMLKHTF